MLSVLDKARKWMRAMRQKDVSSMALNCRFFTKRPGPAVLEERLDQAHKKTVKFPLARSGLSPFAALIPGAAIEFKGSM